MFRKLKTLCVLVGAYELGKVAVSAGLGCNTYFVRSEENLKERYGGGYVLISGSTSGIGKEFANSFAKRGFNLVLIARDQKKLENEREEILKNNSGIEVKTIVYDFSNDNPEDFKNQVLKNLSGLDLSILVNNVGIIQKPGKFENLPAEKVKEIINVNMISQSYLSNYFLSQIKGRSNLTAIINMSSSISLCPDPFSALYGATKFFNKYLSESLCGKVSSDVTTVLPGMVETQMAREFRGNFSPLGLEVVQARSVANNVLRAMGEDQVLAGSPNHGVPNLLQSNFPATFSKLLFLFQMNIMSLAKN